MLSSYTKYRPDIIFKCNLKAKNAFSWPETPIWPDLTKTFASGLEMSHYLNPNLSKSSNETKLGNLKIKFFFLFYIIAKKYHFLLENLHLAKIGPKICL